MGAHAGPRRSPVRSGAFVLAQVSVPAARGGPQACAGKRNSPMGRRGTGRLLSRTSGENSCRIAFIPQKDASPLSACYWRAAQRREQRALTSPPQVPLQPRHGSAEVALLVAEVSAEQWATEFLWERAPRGILRHSRLQGLERRRLLTREVGTQAHSGERTVRKHRAAIEAAQRRRDI